MNNSDFSSARSSDFSSDRSHDVSQDASETALSTASLSGDCVPPELQKTTSLKNVILMSIGWCLTACELFIMISTTILAAKKLAGNSAATLPLGIYLFSAAFSLVLTLQLAKRFGRFKVFFVTALLGLVGAVLAQLAIYFQLYWLLVVSSIPQGITYASGNNYRFVAAGFSKAKFKPTAIAIVILGGLPAIFLGPELSLRVQNSLQPQYLASYVLLACIYLAHCILMLFVDFAKLEEEEKQKAEHSRYHCPKQRPLGEQIWLVMKDGDFIFSCMAAPVSYATMGAVMAGTPLALVDPDIVNGDARDSTLAVQMHMLGMFLPSLVTGRVMHAVGLSWTAILGNTIATIGSALYFANYQSVAVYTISIFLVGFGWNWVYIATSSYLPKILLRLNISDQARFSIQGIFDTAMLILLAIVMTTAGPLFAAIGWRNFLYLYISINAYLQCVIIFHHFKEKRTNKS